MRPRREPGRSGRRLSYGPTDLPFLILGIVILIPLVVQLIQIVAEFVASRMATG